MFEKDWKFRLDDMLSAINEIEEYVLSLSKNEFYKNIPALRTAERNIEIIGEAANKIPKKIHAENPNIPWRDIITMRNIVAHEYSNVNYETIWKTLQTDLPILKTMLINMKDKYNEI